MNPEKRTVRVGNISDLAGEREIREFFSFSGEIEHVEIRSGEVGALRTAFVTFKDSKALEIALLLSRRFDCWRFFSITDRDITYRNISVRNQLEDALRTCPIYSTFSYDCQGATIVDQIVGITLAENYVLKVEEQAFTEDIASASPGDDVLSFEARNSRGSGRIYVSKAQEVMNDMLAKGSAIKQDAVSKAKAFDEKHQLTANASAKVISFDKRVGLTEKINVGITVVNEKVKSVDQRLQVSDKTLAALTVAERKLMDTGTTVKTNRYVTAGTAWLNGAFGKVAKASQVAGAKSKEKFQLAVANLTVKDSVIAA